MNIDELKLVLSTVEELGKNAEGLGTWWVAAAYIVPEVTTLLVWAMVLTAVVLVVRTVHRHNAISDANEIAMRRWRDQLRIGCPGVLLESEHQQVLDRINRLVREVSEIEGGRDD